MKKDFDVLDRVLSFDHFWDANLSVRLKNAEMMLNYPNKSECKSQMMNLILNDYIDSTIERCLLNIYEAVIFIRQMDPSFIYDMNDESDPIGILISYRNWLIAHREENRFRVLAAKRAKRAGGARNQIFRDIDSGIIKIKAWIQKQDLEGRGSQVIAYPEFTADDFSSMIKSVPEQQFK